ncbi:MAG: hypothetical protein QG656_592, partial [Candidatus Hydrogenedentes bacterium]|nr:hypothetical protein [Candidatus Hydrogenedentota bacterium]
SMRNSNRTGPLSRSSTTRPCIRAARRSMGRPTGATPWGRSSVSIWFGRNDSCRWRRYCPWEPGPPARGRSRWTSIMPRCRANREKRHPKRNGPPTRRNARPPTCPAWPSSGSGICARRWTVAPAARTASCGCKATAATPMPPCSRTCPNGPSIRGGYEKTQNSITCPSPT